MKGFDRLSHAYITDGKMAEDLAMAIVCGGGADGAVDGGELGVADDRLGIAGQASNDGEGGGGGADGAVGATDRPCKRCKDCIKAEKGIHPDIIFIERQKDKRSISVDQIRDLKKGVYFLPNDCARKVYVVNDTETMRVEAQNAFLQILEEPPAHAAFILKTSNPALLLKTVRSRCVDLKTQPLPTVGGDDFPEARQLASDFVSALGDNMLLTKCMFRIDKLDRPAFSAFIFHAREQLVQRVRDDPHNPRNPHMKAAQLKTAVLADEMLVKAIEMLELNVNVGHISGMLCAGLMA